MFCKQKGTYFFTMLLNIPSLLIIHLVVGTSFLLDRCFSGVPGHIQKYSNLHSAGTDIPGTPCHLHRMLSTLFISFPNKYISFLFLNSFFPPFSWSTSSRKLFRRWTQDINIESPAFLKNACILPSFRWIVWQSIHSIMKIIFSCNFEGTVTWSSCIMELLKRSLKVACIQIFYGVLAGPEVLKFHSNTFGRMPFFIHLAQHFPGHLIKNLDFHSGKCYFYENLDEGAPKLILFPSFSTTFCLFALYSQCLRRQNFTSEYFSMGESFVPSSHSLYSPRLLHDLFAIIFHTFPLI